MQILHRFIHYSVLTQWRRTCEGH